MNWMLLPYAVSTTAPIEPNCTASSPAFAGGGDDYEADSVSSPSAASSSFSSSSSSTDHLSFITLEQRGPSASPLCFGARKLLWRSSNAVARAHVPKTKTKTKTTTKKNEELESADATTRNKGDAVVVRYLRKISRRLRKAAKESPPPCRVDDTARERAEAVASAVAYCKQSLRRGPVSSPSLDRWLQGWREKEEVITIAGPHCNECTDSMTRPARQSRTGWLVENKTTDVESEESRRPPSPSSDDVLLTASPVAHGKELLLQHCRDTGDKFGGAAVAAAAAAAAKETANSSSPSPPVGFVRREFGSFKEIEFLKTCSREEQIIDRHFDTIRT